MKLSWDAEEWDGSIWSEFSDSKIKLELEGGEVVEAPPFRSIKRQQERMDRGVQITRTYTLKELKESQRKEFPHSGSRVGKARSVSTFV